MNFQTVSWKFRALLKFNCHTFDSDGFEQSEFKANSVFLLDSVVKCLTGCDNCALGRLLSNAFWVKLVIIGRIQEQFFSWVKLSFFRLGVMYCLLEDLHPVGEFYTEWNGIKRVRGENKFFYARLKSLNFWFSVMYGLQGAVEQFWAKYDECEFEAKFSFFL